MMTLLRAVCFYVLLGSILRVLVGVNVVAVRHLCVMGGFLMIACLVMLGGFSVVFRSVSVMFGCLLVMFGCFL